jgi:hypothetical protein
MKFTCAVFAFWIPVCEHQRSKILHLFELTKNMVHPSKKKCCPLVHKEINYFYKFDTILLFAKNIPFLEMTVSKIIIVMTTILLVPHSMIKYIGQVVKKFCNTITLKNAEYHSHLKVHSLRLTFVEQNGKILRIYFDNTGNWHKTIFPEYWRENTT